MRAVEIILGLLVILVAARAGWDEFLSPLLEGMTAREKVTYMVQGLVGAAGMWLMLVLIIGLAPVNS